MPVLLTAYLLFGPIKQKGKSIDIQIAYSQRLIQSITDAEPNIEESIHEFHSLKKATIILQESLDLSIQTNERISLALECLENNHNPPADWPMEIRNNLLQIKMIDSTQPLSNNFSYISHVISSQYIEKYEKFHKLLDFFELYINFKLYSTVNTDPYGIEKDFIKNIFKFIKFDSTNTTTIEKHYAERNNEITQFLTLTSAIAFNTPDFKNIIISCIKHYTQKTSIPTELNDNIITLFQQTINQQNNYEVDIPILNYEALSDQTLQISDKDHSYTTQIIVDRMNKNVKHILTQLKTNSLIETLATTKTNKLFFENLIRLSNEYLSLAEYYDKMQNLNKYQNILMLYSTLKMMSINISYHETRVQCIFIFTKNVAKNTISFVKSDPFLVFKTIVLLAMFCEYIYDYTQNDKNNKLLNEIVGDM